MHITATDLRNNIKKHLDYVEAGHMIIVTRGSESFALTRKDKFTSSVEAGGDKLLHSKIDSLIDAVEAIAKKGPIAPSADSRWNKVVPGEAPDQARLDEIAEEIAGIEDELAYCQDPDVGKKLFDKMGNLYAEKDEIILRRNEK